MESWILNDAITKKLEAFELWLYRRMLKIPWIARIINIEVLRRMNKNTELINTFKVRKLQYLGHIMRNEKNYSILQFIVQGKIFGKRGPVRRRISWLQNLRVWFGNSSSEMFCVATDKKGIAGMVTNIRNQI